MNEIPEEIETWLEAGIECAVAVVVDTWSSAPRPAGAMMAVSGTGEVAGSLSGGCVEGAVVELAEECMTTGKSALAHYGVSDDDAFAVGLACGGKLDVLVFRADDKVSPALRAYARASRAGQRAALAVRMPDRSSQEAFALTTVTESGDAEPKYFGTLGNSRLDLHVSQDAEGFAAVGRSGVREYDETGQRLGAGTRIFITTSTPPPRLLIFGAIDYAAALAELGRFLGYRVTVCDARKIFATSARFPAAHEVVVSWPHRYLAREIDKGAVDGSTVIAVLTHELKFDVSALTQAVRSPAGFVGALGSRRTHAKRVQALTEAGLTEAEISRIHAPLGLDLGSRTPQETAVSIFAEILQHKTGASGHPLVRTTGPIHKEA